MGSIPVLPPSTGGLSGDKDSLWARLVFFLGDPGFWPPAQLPLAIFPCPRPDIVEGTDDKE